jgi:hypothetical protein
MLRDAANRPLIEINPGAIDRVDIRPLARSVPRDSCPFRAQGRNAGVRDAGIAAQSGSELREQRRSGARRGCCSASSDAPRGRASSRCV